jgi:hypothetical protein
VPSVAFQRNVFARQAGGDQFLELVCSHGEAFLPCIAAWPWLAAAPGAGRLFMGGFENAGTAPAAA